MLFPIGDDNQGRLTTPYFTYILIAINVAVFLFLQQAGATESGQRFTSGYAAVPYEITTGVDLVEPVRIPDAEPVIDRRTGRRELPIISEAPGPSPLYLTLLTAMFMHGGWLHIISNMVFLWVFGDNVEDNFGHGKFMIFYLICGIVASFAHILVDPRSPVPSLGASGAIAGVLGAYLIMFPRNRVRSILPIYFFFTTIELPAIVVLGFWIVYQVVHQTFLDNTQTGGVAYMAHIGGFVAGVILTFFLRRKTPHTPYYDYRYR
jgi:membrane associated rhomboid family serine protease